MLFNQKTFTIYRSVRRADKRGMDWLPTGDVVIGTLVPVSASDAIRTNQEFADVKNLLSCDIEYAGTVLEQDELVEAATDKQFKVRTYEMYDNILPHIELYLGDTQWKREVAT